MSAQHATAIPRTSPRPAPEGRPRVNLTVVAEPKPARAHIRVIVACSLIVVAALVTVLILNTTMARGSYEQQALQNQLTGLQQQQQALTEQIDTAGKPANLANQAKKLGMVPAPVPLPVIQLSDGSVHGTASPAENGNGD